MARGRLLVGFLEAIPANSCFAFSWGPFTGPHRITYMRFHMGLTINIENTLGVFTAPSADGFNGSDNLPISFPQGWTPIGDAPNVTGTSVRSQSGLYLPFRHDTSTDSVDLTGLTIDVTGQNFYIKAVARNPTAAGLAFRALINIVENPADVDPDAVVVRPQPGEPPTGSQPPPGGGPSTPPTQPPQQPPTQQPSGALPLPSDLTIPPITIDPADPRGSVREIIKV